MQRHFLKFKKVFPNIVCSPLILISNNSELAAKYLPDDFEQSITSLEINNSKDGFLHGFDVHQDKNFLIAENEKNINQIKSKLESTMYNLTKRANRNNK